MPAQDTSDYECPINTEDDGNYETLSQVRSRQSIGAAVDAVKTAEISRARQISEANDRRPLPPKPPPKTTERSKDKPNVSDRRIPAEMPTYINDIPRGEATQFVSQRTKTDQTNDAESPKPSSHKNSKATTSNTGDNLKPVAEDHPIIGENEDAGHFKIDELSIDEVCKYLKKLKLEKHCDLFKEQLIDGEILKELDEDVLVSDFGFRKIEVIRLMKFITEGHVPQ